MHFSAFHPDWKMREIKHTPAATLTRAREIAFKNSLHCAYTGNVHDSKGSSTWCHSCGELLIEGDWYVLGHRDLDGNGCCTNCGTQLPGHFLEKPAQFGAQRIPVYLNNGR